jgi:hypothetical protein
LLSVVILLSTYFLTVGKNPLLTDDTPQALVNRTPNIIDYNRAKVVLGKVDIRDCVECFPEDSYKSSWKQTDGLHFSNTQPFLYYSKNEKKYPVLLSRKMSGLPFLYYKSLSENFGAKAAKNIFNLGCLLISLIFSFLFLKSRFSPRVAGAYSLLLSFSPLFLMNYGGYLSEQMIMPFFWMTCFFLNRDKKIFYILSILTFSFGILVKLNFLVSIIPLFILTGQSNKDLKKLIPHLSFVILYFILLVFLKDGREELIFRQGQGYFKPFSHLLLLAQEFVAMVSQSLISINDPLAIKDLKLSYFNNFSNDTFKSIEIRNIVFFLFFITSFFIKNIRYISLSLIAWVVSCFVVGHKDVTYSLRFSETYALVPLIIVLVLDSVIENKRKFLLGSLIVAVLSIWNFFSFQSHFLNSGPNPNQTISLFKDVTKVLTEKGVNRPIMYFDENEWGYLEFLSNEKIQPIYAQGLETRMSLGEVFLLQSEGYVLVNYSKVHLHEGLSDIFIKENGASIQKAASSSGVNLQSIHSFEVNGEKIYELIKFTSERKFDSFSKEFHDNVISIPREINFR